jgi:nitronate monooxygenase
MAENRFMDLLARIGISLPIVQAPMAGVSTPRMAAAVAEAGGLGSIAVGAAGVAGAAEMIAEMRARTDRPFNVNLFVHAPPRADAARETAWLKAMAPLFAQFDTEPPKVLQPVYKSFAEDDAMLAVLLDLAPPVVSFHFGLPSAQRIAALKSAGCLLLSTATTQDEAEAARKVGIDAIVAQGFEAGGHRGMFDPDAPDESLDAMALARLLVAEAGMPVIVAGGIMDGRGIADALSRGAVAAQLGTAFIGCPESSASEAFRQALRSGGGTTMTSVISGRPARCLVNRFTAWGATYGALTPPDYPIAYDAGKALDAAARAAGEFGYGAQWAGTGASYARTLPAGELVRTLAIELAEAGWPGLPPASTPD